MTQFFKAGDIIKINMSTAKGHEHKATDLQLWFQKKKYIWRTDLIWALPITNTDKGYPTYVPVNGRTKNKKTTGYVLCEKIKAIDPVVRNAKLSDEAHRKLLEACKEIIGGITYIGESN